MRVLITNNALVHRAGSELFVRDLALALLRRGHTPIAYSTELGPVARELTAATVPVIDDLNAIGAAPDIIHGHHHLDTMTALLHFDRTPVVCFCHGWTPWEEAPPPRSPRILRYIAVDETCRDRLVFRHGIPEAQVRLQLNFVDLERFQPRPPLPARPAKALIFSNNFNDGEDANVIREACGRLGITVDVMGLGSGRVWDAPESRLGEYDLVFAKARAALEALATGAAVIVCDRAGLGGMVTLDGLAEKRRQNFGIRQLREWSSVENITREILRYDARDAGEVTACIRAEAGLDEAVDRLISIYREVIAEADVLKSLDRGLEARATSSYLRWLSPILKSRHSADAQAGDAGQRLEILRAENQRSAEERREIDTRLASQADQIEKLTGRAMECDRLESRLVASTQQVDGLTRRVADRDALAARVADCDALAARVADRDALASRVAALTEEVAMLSKHVADRESLQARVADQAKEIAAHGGARAVFEARQAQATLKAEDLERAVVRLTEERDVRQRQLDQIFASRAWRWVTRYGEWRARLRAVLGLTPRD